MLVHELMNVLYVQADGAYVRLDHDSVKVQINNETKLRLPLNRLAGVVCIGNVLMSPALMRRCAEMGAAVVLLDRRGRFRARLEGRLRGNVLLRRAQHLAVSDVSRRTEIARQMVAGKVQNSRQFVLRAARDSKEESAATTLANAAKHLADAIVRVREAQDLNAIRGCEGDAARAYFQAFAGVVRADHDSLKFAGRNRRPPRDPVNAMLSFVYALLREECASALESVGLDPQVGFLHVLRPGRPALALDLMEELRAVVADRLVATLINRRQMKPEFFEEQPGGGVFLTEEGRRLVITEYQKRKSATVRHALLDRTIPLGLVPHVQARVLARHLRGDLPHYLPYQHR